MAKTLASLLMLLCLILAACGAPAQPSPTPASANPSPLPASPTAPPAGPSIDPNNLIVVHGAPVTTLDPGYASSGDDIRLIYMIYDGLIRYKAGSTEVEAALAESWEVEEDGKTWNFYLRKGVTFHDGTPFNADAVLVNFRRLIDKDDPLYGKGGDFSYFDYLLGSEIEAIEKVDEFTVQFKLKDVFAPFLTHLAYYSGGIASPSAIQADPASLAKKPLGAGPYKLESWQDGEEIVLVANESYWAGKPKQERITFRQLGSEAIRLQELQNGKAHIMIGILPEQLEMVRANPSLKLVQTPGANLSWILMNPEQEPLFEDAKVRQAILHAVDTKTIVNQLWGGLAEPAVNPYPSTMPCWNSAIQPYAYDPVRAKALLAEAGHPDGFEITLDYPTSPRAYLPDPVGVAKAVAAYLEQVGIKVKLREHTEWGDYFGESDRREYGFHLIGWYDIPEPDNFMRAMLVTSDYSRGPFPAEMARLSEQAIRTYKIEERCESYSKMQEIFHETADRIALAHSSYVDVASVKVDGFSINIDGSEIFRTVTVRK